MTPYVIDRQKRNTYITLFFVFTIASFVLGYYLGFQSAVIQSLPDSLPASSTDTSSKTDIKKTVAPIAEKPADVKKDVANASKAPAASTKKTSNKSSNKVAVKSKPAKKPVVKTAKSQTTAKVKAVEKKVVPVKEKLDAKPQLPTQPVAKAAVGAQTATDDLPTSTSQVPQNIVGTYSVQAGLFGSRRNALKYIDRLKAAGFNAYLNEYLASDGVMKYNVRFGYFPDRKTGEVRLGEFKTQFTTPAYLVINK